MKKHNFIFGMRPVIEALKEGKSFEKVFLKQGLQGELASELRNLLLATKIHFQYVPQEKLNKLTSKNHQGVVAYTSLVDYYSLEDILPSIYEAGRDPFFLMLDRITDVRNFGAIARTANCSGVDAIIIPVKGSALINKDAMKTSAGALNSMKICRVDKLENTLKHLSNSGLRIFGASENASSLYYNVDYSGPKVIVMGSEEDGLSPGILKIADELIKIPVIGSVASLNVSVATGIILYECVRSLQMDN